MQSHIFLSCLFAWYTFFYPIFIIFCSQLLLKGPFLTAPQGRRKRANIVETPLGLNQLADWLNGTLLYFKKKIIKNLHCIIIKLLWEGLKKELVKLLMLRFLFWPLMRKSGECCLDAELRTAQPHLRRLNFGSQWDWTEETNAGGILLLEGWSHI